MTNIYHSVNVLRFRIVVFNGGLYLPILNNWIRRTSIKEHGDMPCWLLVYLMHKLVYIIMINYISIMISLLLHSLAKRNQGDKRLGKIGTNFVQQTRGNCSLHFQVIQSNLLFPQQRLVQSSLQSLWACRQKTVCLLWLWLTLLVFQGPKNTKSNEST